MWKSQHYGKFWHFRTGGWSKEEYLPFKHRWNKAMHHERTTCNTYRLTAQEFSWAEIHWKNHLRISNAGTYQIEKMKKKIRKQQEF